ncbi:pyruvate dehydrogenase E2 component (dihydrolipoamide acetyltransferase) [Dongia mobilis]|uniref:Dihydrolipoamide acetyltransferase component of pyruvate dehydrogenase complex n=2 Tax=Dongia mobilis TaxID=578943 RepID=A0A4R6WXL7_9PROT|nr:pyruvate dehydrogenase E2 component (dihydrolipoamide acetyltransferase) [Dongia mobilis]
MGVFRMPSLGADMEAGTLVEWLKQPGDTVRSGDIIAVIETQKGAIEVEVFESGTLERHLVEVGATVPVGTGLAVIRSDGTPAGAHNDLPPVAPVAVAPPSAPATPPPLERTALAGSFGPKASPAARRLAQERGIDLDTLTGSGPEGAIVFVDVEQAWLRRGASVVTGPAKSSGVDGMRAAIAAAMARAKREIPHYYLGHSVDVSDSLDWMGRWNDSHPPADRLVFSALLAKAVALALDGFAEFNGQYRDGQFHAAAQVHLGIAIALRGGGLVAPAIHDAARLSLPQLMTALRDLTNRVRAGRFRGSELADSTVTLTSLGERGVDWVQPVIYPPQVAIIGAGAIQRRPWLVGDSIVPREICQLTLAADHRVSDGHRGGLLLREIEARLQAPEAL